ncbi:MAG: tRNA (guanosine(46)-N7)-methyltransferase TrmB [Verrucomicrobiales bacterium]|jgi:tRNA (guanine-N7-)-methyltransferase|nr:tRNA (guanosine(46)-N7)-methyltransferase TrmB [Verrucomicrobiales bacterium]MDE2713966.1 tRNA (guanosine(46)-N7)-methyltransferase TrmB [Verrucomicrobiota bacterium]|tara:strand:+ start:648 stop:1232 length:585 start_codon:yes stop_codon:yes gene_type:complete
MSLLHEFESVTEPLRLEELFPVTHPAELEIGCGDGGFLLEWATRHPKKNFIGVERLLGRIRKLDKKGRRAELTNLHLLRFEARYLLQYLLPDHAFDAVHIYFPDPWPKDKHRRHRLIGEHFPELARRILLPNGIVHLRTDDPAYFEQMQESFLPAKYFSVTETPVELANVTTEFERQWNEEGKPTLRVSYRLEK